MNNIRRRLGQIAARMPKKEPPQVILTREELAAELETLLELAEGYPDEMIGRYSLKQRAALAIDIFEDVRRRWAGDPIPLPLTAESRAMLLAKEMKLQEADMLYSLVGRQGPELAWETGHFEGKDGAKLVWAPAGYVLKGQ